MVEKTQTEIDLAISAIRQEAKAQGKPEFFPGIPCPNGHLAERATKSNQCVECMREQQSARMKERWRTQEWREYQTELHRELMTKRWRDPERRKRHSEIMREHWSARKAAGEA